MPTDHTVSQEDDDIRLDRWFKRHYPGFPHSMLEKQLRKGAIRLDGKKAKSSDRVRVGQLLRCPEVSVESDIKPKRQLSPQELTDVKKWVLYQDSRLIVVNKPAGLATQGGSKILISLDDYLTGLSEQGARPKLTHRLDRDTSGALVLAKNAKVATTLMHLFASRQVEKTYLALVIGVPQPLRGTIDAKLLKKANPLKESAFTAGPEGRDYEVVSIDDEGQVAVTDYEVIDTLASKFALVQLYPRTGRLHQLRVHMAAIGCPIVGDHKYGGSLTDAESIGVENRLHLHAKRIQIPSFASGKRIDVNAPLPPHMKKSFKALGISVAS